MATNQYHSTKAIPRAQILILGQASLKSLDSPKEITGEF